MFEAGLEESVKVLRQKVQLLRETHCDMIMCSDAVFQTCLNTNVKGDSFYTILMVQTKIPVSETSPLFVMWSVLTTVVTWKIK